MKSSATVRISNAHALDVAIVDDDAGNRQVRVRIARPLGAPPIAASDLEVHAFGGGSDELQMRSQNPEILPEIGLSGTATAFAFFALAGRSAADVDSVEVQYAGGTHRLALTEYLQPPPPTVPTERRTG